MSKHWTLDDIDWDRLDRSAVSPELLATVKTASMVEANAADYVVYLHNVFRGDDSFCQAADIWGEEEIQHGRALGRWCELVDPDFSFEDCLERVKNDGYQLPLDVSKSVRGSCRGELLARCLVESATTSFYSAMTDCSDEPVLSQIAEKIAADEVRHYSLFRRYLEKYENKYSKLSLWKRIKVVVGRINESDDDEFAFSYYATNIAAKAGSGSEPPYEREYCAIAYESVALGLYQREHLFKGARMMVRAFGYKPDSLVSRAIVPLLWVAFQRRQKRLARQAQSAV